MATFTTANQEGVPNEGIPACLKVKLSSFARPLSSEETTQITDILVSLEAPAHGTRPPTDICCVVDVSGSMGVECTNGDSESQGLNVLAVVKHACKTVIHSLTPQDRFSLVKYSSNAEVVLNLTNMNAAGLKMAELAIDRLEEGGQTNLWDGLQEGLNSLKDDSGRMKAVLLLTDGQPNVNPPRGICNMFRHYKESHDMVCTVSTFGFGYNLDSKLLEELAIEGQGMYAFIPDGSFVGTAFVNATSNILSTAARQVVAKVSGLSDAAQHITTPGVNCSRASWGFQIPLGAVMFGQSKDFVLSVPTEIVDSLEVTLRVDVDYLQSGSLETQAAFQEGLTEQADPEALVQSLRLRFVDMVRAVVSNKELNKDQVPTFSSMAKEVAPLARQGDERINDLIKDLDGQITEAVSHDNWYNKWGKHYLPSLAIAHSLQQCHNFKDPGVQHYGGPLFAALRETAEAVFVKLPPPKPPVFISSYRPVSGRGAAAAPAPAPARPVDMSAYYNRGGGCFTASTLVTMANGCSKRVDELLPQDKIQTFIRQGDGQLEIGFGTVKFVTEMKLNTPALLVTLPGGLQVTAWHPICVPSSGPEDRASVVEEWVFPASLAASNPDMAGYHSLEEVSSVFNLAMKDNQDDQGVPKKWHGAMLNGVPTITLGHGIENDPVASHAYYGTQVVIDEMESLPRDNVGRVMIPAPCHQGEATPLNVEVQTATEVRV